MAIAIKLLASGHLVYNVISWTELTSAVPTGKAQIIKCMRFYNTHATQSITLTVALVSTSTVGGTPDEKTILAAPIAAGTFLYDDREITLQAGQNLKFKTSTTSSGPIDFIVCGIERDA